MTLPGDFANHPKSVTEIKAERSGDGSIWTARDALIDLLRDLDSGVVTADALVICFREPLPDGNAKTHFRNACPDILVAQGLMQRVAWRLNDPEG
jgi:hypothetical protein